MRDAMQRFSRSAIIPIKFMAVMGLFLAISVIFQLEFMPDFLQLFGSIIKNMMDIMLNNLSLIFCVSITASLANKNKLEAAVLSLIVFLMFLAANHTWLEMTGMLAQEGSMGFYGTSQNIVLGIQVVDMNVFLGMILGPLTAYFFNKFGDKNFIDMFSIYGGSRFVFIIMIPITLVFAILMCYIWPVVSGWINSMSSFIAATGFIGVFLYGFGNRFLIPTGLHHLLWMPFCYTAVGGTAIIDGEVYTGAVNIFYAEMANAANITSLDPSIRFAFFGFSKVFASIPIALALIYTAKKEKRDEVKGLVLPGAFVGTIAGITEPLDFMYLFSAPILWLVHSLLSGLSEALLWELGIRTFVKDGIIDTIVSNSVFSPKVTKVGWFIVFGLFMSVIWFVVFVFLIKKFNLKTVGREELVITDIGTESIIEKDSKVFQSNEKDEILFIIDGLGGKDNIENISNCFTRLRVDVKDIKNIDEDEIKKYPLQKGVVYNGNNIQIIIGMGVQDVKNEICELLDIE